MNVFFAGKTITSKGKRGERLNVISNRFSGPEMLELYKQRWGIELLFNHLKKRGFNLEDTHMTSGKKSKNFSLLLLWDSFLAMRGLANYDPYVNRQKQRNVKAISALDLRMFNNPHLNEKDWNSFIHLLKRPFWSGVFVV